MRLFLISTLFFTLSADVTAGPRWRARSSYQATPAPILRFESTAVATTADGTTGDALAEVNAARASRGLPPFLHDEGLAQAARTCAELRAQYLLAGHTANDFAALPPGSTASAAGCGALEPSWGWGTCCTYENCRYAGAAVVTGRDGRRFMHLFVR